MSLGDAFPLVKLDELGGREQPLATAMATDDDDDDDDDAYAPPPPDREMSFAAEVLLHLFGFGRAQEEQDKESTRLLWDVFGAVLRFAQPRRARTRHAIIARMVDIIEDVYRRIDEDGNLPEPGEPPTPSVLAVEPWRAARTQKEFFRLRFEIPEGEDEGYLQRWSLTRSKVTEEGGPNEAAAKAAADFSGSYSWRTYYNAKKRWGDELQEWIPVWCFWGRGFDRESALREFLELLDVEPKRAKRAASIAFGGK